MTSPLVHYEKRERLRADTVNALVDHAYLVGLARDMAANAGVETLSPWPIPFKNLNAAEMPPFGVAEIKSPLVIADILGCNVDKIPGAGTAELRRQYLVNGPIPARSNGTGWGCLLESANMVLYDTADGTPDVNSEWGVAVDSWKLKKDRYGFMIRGATQTKYGNTVLAQQFVLQNVLIKPPTGLSTGSAWDVDTEKDCRVFTKKFTADADFKIKDVMNYTVKITNSDDKMVLSWYGGGAIGAKLKC